MRLGRLPKLLSLLAQRSPMTGAELRTALGVSQPTLSRLLGEAGGQVLRLGRTRGSSYLLTRDVGRAGRVWPLYRLDPNALPHRLGRLHVLHGGHWLFEVAQPLPAWLHGEFSRSFAL